MKTRIKAFVKQPNFWKQTGGVGVANILLELNGIGSGDWIFWAILIPVSLVLNIIWEVKG